MSYKSSESLALAVNLRSLIGDGGKRRTDAERRATFAVEPQILIADGGAQRNRRKKARAKRGREIRPTDCPGVPLDSLRLVCASPQATKIRSYAAPVS